jgi:hypothetical protein
MNTDKYRLSRRELRELSRIEFVLIREIRVKIVPHPCPSVFISG